MTNITTDSTFDLEDSYRKAVRGSSYREYVLKAFADEPDEQMRTERVYSKITKETDIKRESISTFTGHLVSDDYGSPLKKVRHGVYSFSDNIFKAYCKARQYTYWT